jgi:CRISPR-associated protein Csc3
MLRMQGYEPFLFFPEGVIYLVSENIEAQVDLMTLTRAVWEGIATLLTGGRQAKADEEDEEEEEGKEAEDEAESGLRITRTKDYMKVPPAFYELLSPKTLMEAGRQTAMAIRNSKTAARFGAELADDRGLDIKRLSRKQREELFTRIGREWAVEQHLPTDVRVDQLAEYLAFLYRRIFGELFRKLQGVTGMMLDVLGLADEVAPERAERQKGGTPSGWFYTAARYVQQHPELNPDELEEVMNRLAVRSLQFIDESGLALPNENENPTARTFQDFAQRIIEIDGRLVDSSEETIRGRFAKELQRYIQSKAENKVVCSLCASSYEASEQDASVVLFKPQQYSTKSPLDRSRLVRGICPICALEMMLRRVQQGLPGSKTQDKQPINLYLYPTYFFTTETAQVIKQFANRLQNLSLSRLIFSHLEQQGFSYQNLFSYEDFIVDEEESGVAHMNGIWKPQYSKEDLAALFFITFLPLGRKLTETDTWIVPNFFALALPMLLGIKCVATPSFVPLYRSGSDFRETVRLDGAHEFTKYIPGAERFRIDELPASIERLLRVYSLHIDVYHEGNNYHWGQLTGLTKDLVTDPLYVFQYYDRRERREGEGKEKNAKSKGKGSQQSAGQRSRGVSQHDQQRYMGIYYAIGGSKDMGFIGRLVDAYAQFYRAVKLDSAYAVLRPLGTAIEVAVESDPRVETDDLLLLLAGAINDDQERVRADQAEGFDPIVTNKGLGDYGTRLALSRQKIENFAQLFIKDCFGGYCDSDRAVLRERMNRIRSAARFYYLTHYGRRDSQNNVQI